MTLDWDEESPRMELEARKMLAMEKA